MPLSIGETVAYTTFKTNSPTITTPYFFSILRRLGNISNITENKRTISVIWQGLTKPLDYMPADLTTYESEQMNKLLKLHSKNHNFCVGAEVYHMDTNHKGQIISQDHNSNFILVQWKANGSVGLHREKEFSLVSDRLDPNLCFKQRKKPQFVVEFIKRSDNNKKEPNIIPNTSNTANFIDELYDDDVPF